jgi:hypothetical protein
MTLTVKLPEPLERDLDLHCRIHRLTKSEVVTGLIEQYLALQAPRQSAYELAEEAGLVGGFDGPADLAAAHKQHLAHRLRAKRAR